MPATFGHPLADKIPMQPDQHAARRLLDIDETAYPVIALICSRKPAGYLGELFLATAQQLLQDYPNVGSSFPGECPSTS